MLLFYIIYLPYLSNKRFHKNRKLQFIILNLKFELEKKSPIEGPQHKQDVPGLSTYARRKVWVMSSVSKLGQMTYYKNTRDCSNH